ncbi:GntR family transcriptional regulator [Gordonia sp. NPDC003424]
MTVQSSSESLYEAVKGAILDGHLQPGSRLRLGAIAQQFDSSAGVLREVLPRLAAEGLVESRAQLGYRVVSVSTDDLEQITECRLLVESDALRRSVLAGDAEWEAGVVAAAHLLARTPVAGDDGALDPAWATAHRRFHTALLAACPNRRLQDMAVALRDQSEVYRHWSRSTGLLRADDVAREHEALAQAAVDHDVDRALEVLSHHLRMATDALLLAGDDSGLSSDIA